MKDQIISLRLSKQEREYCAKLAAQSKLSVSEYARLVLIEALYDLKKIRTDSQPPANIASNDTLEKLTPLLLNVFLYTKKMAENTLGEDAVHDCRAIADKVLKEWGS